MKACLGEVFEGTQECLKCAEEPHCRLFANYLKRTDQSPGAFFDVEYNGQEFYVVYKGDFGPEKLLDICHQQRIYEGKQSRKAKLSEQKKGKDDFNEKLRRKAGMSTKKYWIKRVQRLVEDYRHFQAWLTRECGAEFAKEGVAQKRGQFADHWHFRLRKPITIYYKNKDYRPVNVCTVFLQTQVQCLEIIVRVPPEVFDKHMQFKDRFIIMPLPDNAHMKGRELYNTRCVGLDKEKLAIVAETIGRIVKSGYFDENWRKR